jgi:hypothetical protein
MGTQGPCRLPLPPSQGWPLSTRPERSPFNRGRCPASGPRRGAFLPSHPSSRNRSAQTVRNILQAAVFQQQVGRAWENADAPSVPEPLTAAYRW